MLSRLGSPASRTSRRVKTSLKSQIWTGISEFHVLLPEFEAAGALFAEMEVICDTTQGGQRQVHVVLCTATSHVRIHVELEVTVGTSPIHGRQRICVNLEIVVLTSPIRGQVPKPTVLQMLTASGGPPYRTREMVRVDPVKMETTTVSSKSYISVC